MGGEQCGEKKAFVMCPYKLVHKYLERKKPGVDKERLHELTQVGESGLGEDEEVVSQQGEGYS